MKYEMIFGDEKLFDGCDENAIAVVDDMTGVRKSSKIEFFSDDALNFETVDIDSRRFKLAMRRIIKEPKRWTWEDKKAGRLPDVGAKCSHCHSVDERTVLSVTDKYVGIERDNSDIKPYFVTHAEFIQYYIPIETPAEKAQRLEDEFVNFVLHHEKIQINSSEELVAAKRAIKLAYKLQLSGELPMPKKDGE